MEGTRRCLRGTVWQFGTVHARLATMAAVKAVMARQRTREEVVTVIRRGIPRGSESCRYYEFLVRTLLMSLAPWRPCSWTHSAWHPAGAGGFGMPHAAMHIPGAGYRGAAAACASAGPQYVRGVRACAGAGPRARAGLQLAWAQMRGAARARIPGAAPHGRGFRPVSGCPQQGKCRGLPP